METVKGEGTGTGIQEAGKAQTEKPKSSNATKAYKRAILARDELYEALNKFQALVRPIKMNQHAEVKYQKDGRWIDKSYDYADLQAIWEGIRKPLCDNQLGITHEIETNWQGGVCEVMVRTILFHTNGSIIQVAMKWNVLDSKIHTLGSTITYLKRYEISAILGIVTEADDDGGKAQDQDEKGKKPVQNAPQAPAGAQPPKKEPVKQTTKKANPSDEEQATAGLILTVQVKALQDKRNLHKIPDHKWKAWLFAKYAGIMTAWKIKQVDFAAIDYTLTNNPGEISGFATSDDVTQ